MALSVALASTGALAQDGDTFEEQQAETPGDPEDEVTPPQSATGQTNEAGTIFVTGSRIRRDEFTSASPVTIIDPEISVRQGLMDTASMLQGAPIAAGSAQVTSAISSNFVTNGGFGAQTISLRGLGAERTLVLLNGRRAGPAGTRGAVSSFDLNVLPQSIVGRVDVLKDGASSIYGSDAVAGVVNLITKTDTDGVEFNFFGSAPFDTGGEQWSASATWGTTFDRGHVLIAANYYRQNELARGQREYLGCGENYVFTDSSLSTRADLIDPRTGDYRCDDLSWGHVWTYDGAALGSIDGQTNLATQGSGGTFGSILIQYDYPGDNLGQYIPPPPQTGQAGDIGIPPGWYVVGYDQASLSVQNSYHPLQDNDTVIPQTDRYTVYADAAYSITDSMEVYVEGLYNKRKTYQNGSRQIWGFGYGETFDYYYYGYGNVVFPGDPRAEGWSGYAVFSPTAFTDQSDNWQEVDYMRGVAGVRGDITDRWSYDVYGQFSRSDGDYSAVQAFNDSVLNYLYYSYGSCEGTIVGEGTPYERPCVDVRLYDPSWLRGENTPQELAFLYGVETGNTVYEQKYGEAIVSGELFNLPGGPIGIAFGGQYREDSIDDNPGYLTQNGNAWGTTTAGRTFGTTKTLEGFGEISLPLLGDMPFFENLELTAAARITNVKAIRGSDGLEDEDNGNWTYKLGANWEVTDWLRFRGTYGTSFRAPALFEQFLADQTSFTGQRNVDPCINWAQNLAAGNISQQLADGCAADGVPGNHTGAGISATIITGGGIGVLDPETSKAWTVGVVLTPSFGFLPNTRFDVAVEYFDIEVNGEIAQLGAGNILTQCYLSEFFPNDPVCDLFARNQDLPAGDPLRNNGLPANIAFVRDSFVNVNSQANNGIDVTARLVHDFPGDMTFSLSGTMTWQLEDVVSLFEGTPIDTNGESGEPKFVGDFNAQLDTGPWNFFYGLDVIGGTSNVAYFCENNFNPDTAPSSDCLAAPSRTIFANPSGQGGATPADPLAQYLDLEAPARFYHSASISREVGENFEITVGMSNIFDSAPPRLSQVAGTRISSFGKGVFSSQYDLLGRRGFVNLSIRY